LARQTVSLVLKTKLAVHLNGSSEYCWFSGNELSIWFVLLSGTS
jgi:hypothetical protein